MLLNPSFPGVSWRGTENIADSMCGGTIRNRVGKCNSADTVPLTVQLDGRAEHVRQRDPAAAFVRSLVLAPYVAYTLERRTPASDAIINMWPH